MSAPTCTDDDTRQATDAASSSPPLPWPDEMSRVLALWAAQIDAATSESHQEMQAISESYFAVANEALESLQQPVPNAVERSAIIKDHITSALVRFQANDRLVQRLMNVQDNLLVLGNFLQGESTTGSNESWRQTLDRIRAGYTMAAERRMFDAAIKHTDDTGDHAAGIEETGRRLTLFDEECQE